MEVEFSSETFLANDRAKQGHISEGNNVLCFCAEFSRVPTSQWKFVRNSITFKDEMVYFILQKLSTKDV
jgi:hypothetical protein